MAQLAAPRRPLRELHLADQPRLHEARLLRHVPASEGTVVAGEWLEELRHVDQHLVGEARSHAASRDQLAVLVVADHDRAEAAAAPPFARYPATDDELLAVDVLHLEPGARPLRWLVAAPEALGDHALKAPARG